jgi:hypothetical protein
VTARGDRERAEALALAEELSGLAQRYRDIDHDLDRAIALDRLLYIALAVNRPFHRDRLLYIARAANRPFQRDLLLYLDRARDRAIALRVLDLALALVRAREVALDLDGALARPLNVDLDLDFVRNLVFHIVRDLDRAAVSLDRWFEGAVTVHNREFRVGRRLLGWIARCLPVDERSRFVAEELGHLGVLPWWRRVDHLVEVAIGTPRQAWIMRREGGRRPA